MAECGCTGDSDGDLRAVHQCDQGGPDRHASHEILRRIDGVDHPSPSGRGCIGAELLADDPVTGSKLGELRANSRLDGPVGIADRGEIRLCVDPQVGGPKARGADLVGDIRKL